VQISHAIGARLLSNCVPSCYNAPLIDSFRFWSGEKNGRGRKRDDIHLTPHASLGTCSHKTFLQNRVKCVWRWASLNNAPHSAVSAFFGPLSFLQVDYSWKLQSVTWAVAKLTNFYFPWCRNCVWKQLYATLKLNLQILDTLCQLYKIWMEATKQKQT